MGRQQPGRIAGILSRLGVLFPDPSELLRAAMKGREDVVKLLLETGKANVNLKDHNGRTPLSFAAQNGYYNVVKLLLATGKAEIDVKDDTGKTPLLWATADRWWLAMKGR